MAYSGGQNVCLYPTRETYSVQMRFSALEGLVSGKEADIRARVCAAN